MEKTDFMVNRKLSAMVTFSAGVLLSMTSCEGMSGESIYDLDKPGEIEEIKKEIIEKAGDILVYEINLNSSEELETSINEVSIITSDQATEETLNRKTFQLTAETEPVVSVIDSEFSVRVHKKNDPQKISNLDFKIIEKNVEAAKKLIPTEFIDPVLFEYTIQFDENKRADSFTINTLMKDENNHLEGNDLVTNYYEFTFEVDSEGNVVAAD